MQGSGNIPGSLLLSPNTRSFSQPLVAITWLPVTISNRQRQWNCSLQRRWQEGCFCPCWSRIMHSDGRLELQGKDPEVCSSTCQGSPTVVPLLGSTVDVFIAHQTGYKPIDFECVKNRRFSFFLIFFFFVTGSHAFQASFEPAI